MSNTIKLKRGSGSDPSANDLVVGELAIRTDSGKIFTKKDNGSVAEISGGGGIDDGDKGDITISNGGDTFTIDSGVIDNANIASNAAIAGTKISPNFGSQAITTTGQLSVGQLASGTQIKAGNPALRFRTTNASLANAGFIEFYQNTNNFAARIRGKARNSANGQILFDVEKDSTMTNILLIDDDGIDVTGNITGTGNLSLTSTATSSSAAPELDLFRNSASPADADYLGTLKFSGESDDGSKEVYAKITGKIDDASSGTEDGILEFMLHKAGSNNIAARFTSTDLKLINGTGLEVAGNITSTGSLILNQGIPEIQLNATSHENDFRIINYQGNFIVQDVDALANRLVIESDGTTTIQRNLNCAAGVDVTGNITVTGLVDGVDIATRDTLFGGLTSSSGVLTNGVTATTQSASDNSTKVATTAYTDTAIANLIDSSPSTLNTLNELASALGDDPNFATTVTNSIATKLPLAGGTLTGNLTIENTEPQIFLKDSNNNDDFTIRNTNGVFTVRDSTNGVDRLTINSSGTAKILGKTEIGNDLTRPSALDSDADGACRIGGGDVHLYVASLGQSGGYKVAVQAARSSDFASFTLNLQSNGGALQRGGNTVWDAGTDGAGSGLDADLLDGVQGSSYLRSDANDTLTGDLTLNGRLVANHGAAPATGPNFFFNDGGSTTTIGTAATLRVANDGGNAAYSVFEAESGSGSIRLANDGQFYVTGSTTFSNRVRTNISSTVDGFMGEAYSGYFGLKHTDQTLNSEYMILSQDTHTFISASSGSNVYIRGGGNSTTNEMVVSTSGTTIGGNPVLTTANEGSGNGLDADTLDGVQGSSFLRSDAADTASGNLTLNGVVKATNDGSTPDRIGNYKICRVNGAISSIDNLDSFLFSKVDGSYTGGTKPSGSHNGVGIISMQTHTGSYFTQLGLSTNTNDLFIRSANAATSFGSWEKLWSEGNDGSGSGLDADTVDGLQASSFLRSDATDTCSGQITFTNQIISRKNGDRSTQGGNALILTHATTTALRANHFIHDDFPSGSGTYYIQVTESGVTNDRNMCLQGYGGKVGIGMISAPTEKLHVTGNIACTGTVDGRDLQTDGAKLDGIAAGATNVTNTNQLTNGAGFLTSVGTSNISNDAVTFAKIENIATGGIIGRNNSGTGSVERLTASEVRAIINVENGATADQSASEILTLIKTVDGAGSGLDADTLDGISSASFLRSDADDTTSGQLSLTNSNIYPLDINGSNDGKMVLRGSSNPYIRFRESNTDKAYIQWNSGGYIEINNSETNDGIRIKSGNNGLVFTENGGEYRVFHAGNMGSGSGLDADNLDSLGSHQFLRSDASDSATQPLTFSGGGGAVTIGGSSDIRLSNGNWTGNTYGKIQQHSNALYFLGGSSSDYSFILRYNANDRIYIKSNGTIWPTNDSSSDIGTNSNRFANVYADTFYGDGSNLTGISAGATGGGSDEVFYENGQTVTTDYTITNGKNAMAAGPITINSGVTVTVGSGENLTIV